MFTKENASTYGKKSSRKGVKNKVSFEIKEAFKNILNDNLDVLKTDIAAMDSVQRVNALLQIAKYILPTLRASSVEIETDKKEFDIPLISFYKTPEDDN